jgi:hypothetical protein
MAGNEDRQQAAEGRFEPPLRVDDRGLLAQVGGSGGNHRPAIDRRDEPGELALVGRQRRHIELEVSGGGDARRAERAEARGVGGGPHQAKIETPKQGLDGAGKMAPALERARREPAIDDDQRDAASRAAHDGVRPQIGFDQQCETRPPMVEEFRHEGGRVERHELMDDVGRKPLFGERRRGDGSGRDQNVEGARPYARDQRHSGHQLADARPMHPHQHARRPRHGGLAAPFRHPLRMLLAATQTTVEQWLDERRRRRRQQRIGAKRQRQALRQRSSLPACHRRAQGRVRSPG